MPVRKSANVISELEQLKLELAYAHLYYYRNLLKYGPNLFEDDGSIILKSKDGKTENRNDGRALITNTLKYFESKDEPYFYTMCAKLQKVLKDYDKKFKIEKPQES